MNTNRKAIYTIVLIAIVSMLLSACNAPEGVSATYINMDGTARARIYTSCGAVEQNAILHDADQAASTWNGTLQGWLDLQMEYHSCILSADEVEIAVAGN